MAAGQSMACYKLLLHGGFCLASVSGNSEVPPRGQVALLMSVRGEYPAGSVACAENTGELKEGHRNRWFIMFTNVQIDIGFVASTFVPMLVVLACTQSHLRAAWRICLGLGVIPPLSLIYLRLKLQEPEEFKRESMANAKTPWLLVIKYARRLFVLNCEAHLLIQIDFTGFVLRLCP